MDERMMAEGAAARLFVLTHAARFQTSVYLRLIRAIFGLFCCLSCSRRNRCIGIIR